jgi:hypothetical protein
MAVTALKRQFIDPAVDYGFAANLLTETVKAGDLIKAYNQIRNHTPKEAMEILLRAGFWVVSPKDREFWTLTQGQIARACRARVTGYELRQIEKGA